VKALAAFHLFLPDAAQVGTHVRKAARCAEQIGTRFVSRGALEMVAKGPKRASEARLRVPGKISLQTDSRGSRERALSRNRPLVVCHRGLVRCVATCIARKPFSLQGCQCVCKQCIFTTSSSAPGNCRVSGNECTLSPPLASVSRTTTRSSTRRWPLFRRRLGRGLRLYRSGVRVGHWWDVLRVERDQVKLGHAGIDRDEQFRGRDEVEGPGRL